MSSHFGISIDSRKSSYSYQSSYSTCSPSSTENDKKIEQLTEKFKQVNLLQFQSLEVLKELAKIRFEASKINKDYAIFFVIDSARNKAWKEFEDTPSQQTFLTYQASEVNTLVIHLFLSQLKKVATHRQRIQWSLLPPFADAIPLDKRINFQEIFTNLQIVGSRPHDFSRLENYLNGLVLSSDVKKEKKTLDGLLLDFNSLIRTYNCDEFSNHHELYKLATQCLALMKERSQFLQEHSSEWGWWDKFMGLTQHNIWVVESDLKSYSWMSFLSTQFNAFSERTPLLKISRAQLLNYTEIDLTPME